MTKDQQIRVNVHHHFQQIDHALHSLLDYLDSTNPQFSADTAISHWEQFNGLQQRQELLIASSLGDLTDLQIANPPSQPDITPAKMSLA